MSLEKNHLAKQETINEIKDKIQRAKSVVFVDYKQLKVSVATELRTALRKEGVDYKVYKNTLVRRALKELGIEGLSDNLAGSLAACFSYTDETVGARIIKQIKGKKKFLDFKLGLLGTKALDEAQTKELADIPSKEVLLSKLLFVLKSPMQKLAIGLSEVAKKQG